MEVKIILSTIRKNPHVGRSSIQVPGVIEIDWKLVGANKLPDGWNEPDIFIKGWNSGIMSREAAAVPSCFGSLNNFSRLDELMKIPGMSITQNTEIQTIHHLPESAYLYEYENPLLTCRNCGNKFPLDYVETDTNDDTGAEYEICPHCEGISTFGIIKYQSIDAALKLLESEKKK